MVSINTPFHVSTIPLSHMLSRSCNPDQSTRRAFHCRSMPGCMAVAPALGVVDAGVDLDLLLPQQVCSGDGAHLLQEEAVCVHDQDILRDLHIHKFQAPRTCFCEVSPSTAVCLSMYGQYGMPQYTPLAAWTGSTHTRSRQRHQKCSGNTQGVKPLQGAGMRTA